MTELSWLEAVEQVLRKAGGAMHYTDIAEEIARQELRQSVGAIPAATVNGRICSSLNKEGALSPFIRVGRGEYMLRETGQSLPPVVDKVTDEPDTGIIHAFGMYWQRELVHWSSSPTILGRQQIGADAVDFSGQKGVYLLHDNREVVYVGRASDGPVGRRLYEHTLDRLRGRWNRFSWFGVLRVSDTGELTESNFTPDLASWIATMEALLIEGLEPRQNRKRGDDFSAIEYIQSEDPEIKKQQMLRLINKM